MARPTIDGEKVRSYRDDVQFSDDEVRHYSADGHLYAYREGNEHVVVSRGNEPGDRWAKRVPATRTAVVEGEKLWTVPDNWEKRISIKGPGAKRYGVYHIPGSDVHVSVQEPHKNHLVDAWYSVTGVGTLTVTYADEIDWDALEEIVKRVTDSEDYAREEQEALESLYRQRRGFEREFTDAVNMHAEEALFDREHGVVSMEGWTRDPWGDHQFEVDYLIRDYLGIDNDTLDVVLRELSLESVIPSYPEVRVDIENSEGLPQGYLIRGLTEAGCSPAETVDFIMTEVGDETQTAWSTTRGTEQSSISGNVSGAKHQLGK